MKTVLILIVVALVIIGAFTVITHVLGLLLWALAALGVFFVVTFVLAQIQKDPNSNEN